MADTVFVLSSLSALAGLWLLWLAIVRLVVAECVTSQRGGLTFWRVGRFGGSVYIVRR